MHSKMKSCCLFIFTPQSSKKTKQKVNKISKFNANFKNQNDMMKTKKALLEK